MVLRILNTLILCIALSTWTRIRAISTFSIPSLGVNLSPFFRKGGCITWADEPWLSAVGNKKGECPVSAHRLTDWRAGAKGTCNYPKCRISNGVHDFEMWGGSESIHWGTIIIDPGAYDGLVYFRAWSERRPKALVICSWKINQFHVWLIFWGNLWRRRTAIREKLIEKYIQWENERCLFFTGKFLRNCDCFSLIVWRWNYGLGNYFHVRYV